MLPEKEKKKKIHEKLLKNLDECQRQGGPLKTENIDRVHLMSYDQVKFEAGFLKKTTAPNIRYKRKVGKKFIAFSLDELKRQTIDAIKPSKSSVDCINDLLAHVFQGRSNKFEEDNQQHEIGTVGW